MSVKVGNDGFVVLSLPQAKERKDSRGWWKVAVTGGGKA